MGQIKFVTSITMAVLFSIAVIMFATQFGADNEASVLISDDTDFTGIKNDLTGNVTTFASDINSTSDAFFKSSLESGDQTTATGGQFKVGIGSMMKQSGNLIRGGFKKIFGSDTDFGILLTALTFILLFVGVSYAYKSWIGRNPD